MVSTRHHGEGPVQVSDALPVLLAPLQRLAILCNDFFTQHEVVSQAGASPDTHADHAKQQSSAAAAAAQEHGQAADKVSARDGIRC